MSWVHTWNEVVDRVKNRLSKWKMKMLSIGGSQFFKGQELNSKKASWVNWKKVLAPKEKGGLGVSCLYALNRGLMFKWMWRFYTQNTSLWVRVIKVIHGDDGKVGGYVKDGAKSCWLSIVNEINSLKIKTSLDSSFRRVPMGGVEQEQFDELSALVHGVTLTPMSDRWIWDLESSGDFSVVSVRKVKTDSLPTRFNVSRRGIHIDSIMCAICDKGAETSSHLFFSCCMARQTVRMITHWWDVPYGEVDSYEDLIN
nr:RNA-directed DNA polymerase, eukaryota, reverse transcriptase zinc-binding domain protein [Tanacetum cinerariifolium]